MQTRGRPVSASLVPDRLRRRAALIPGWLAMVAIALAILYPLVFVVFAAAKTDQEYARNTVGPPQSVTLVNLRTVISDGEVMRYLGNSLVVVTSAVVLTCVIAGLAGYAFARLAFPFKRAGLLALLGLMMLPHSLIMVPLFGVVQQVGLLNSRLGLVLVYTSLFLPFGIYMLSSYFRRLPEEPFEAAQIDGASEARILRSIAVPLARPAVLTLATLAFMWAWNDLLFALILIQDPAGRTVTVGLALLRGEFTTPVPLLSAAMLFALLPVLIVFTFFHRNLAEGVVRRGGKMSLVAALPTPTELTWIH